MEISIYKQWFIFPGGKIMKKRTTIGFPRMRKEPGEKRVFLPDFIQFLSRYADIYLEEGYGSRSGFTFDDYRQGNARIFNCERREVFRKDYVLVLRSPNENEWDLIPPGTCLISMLHYPTRPKRVERLQSCGIKSISLDSIVDDYNIRLVENMKSVAWNGLETAFSALERTWPALLREVGRPFRVLVLGAGMVGKHAVEAATKLGNIERNTEHMEQGGPGAVAISVGRNITNQPALLESFFREADILVDATQRRDTSKPVVPNPWLAWLPEHAVIADLAVDPYTLKVDPPVVRGVEGIPMGNLDKFLLWPDDPDWDKTVPASIPSENRRPVATCYSWPGIHPEACMDHYGRQISPLMEVLLEKGYDGLCETGGYFERALCRAKLPELKLLPESFT
jgi:alanine dehydrogenase